MSFRLFVYYCALFGAWSAFAGWAVGNWLAPSAVWLKNSIIGLFLGLAVAFGLGLIDAVWNLPLRQAGTILLRVGGAALIGAVGGLLGGLVGGALYGWTGWAAFYIFGWTLVGLLVGAAISLPQVLLSLSQRQEFGGSTRKLLKCVGGGTLGGVVGGGLAFALRFGFETVFSGKSPNLLWSPTALGLVALGGCIGLLVGLAQVILREAWIKVEAGFRPGRELLLAKERTTIGRAEGSDIALFADPAVERHHADIVLDGGRYYLERAADGAATYVNDQPVNGRVALRSGDLIRVGGKSALRFNERQKRTQG
jgi:MFS family permease